VKFDNLADTISWLEANPYCFVEITFVADESIDSTTRKAIMKAHDGIISLIPQLKNRGGQESFALHVDDLGKDMETLFRMYYQSDRGQEPNAQLLSLFKEIISQNDPA
jgi:exonuclease SbcD